MKVCETSDERLLFCIDKNKKCPIKKIEFSSSLKSESEIKNEGWELIK